MFKFGRREKKKLSYVDAHNNAVTKYRRACKAFIWVGVVNFVGLLVGIIQFYIQGSADSVPFYYCFGISEFLFSFMQGRVPTALFWVIVAIFTTATTAGAVLLGLFSSHGKKKLLFTMVSIYFVDWVFVLLAYFLVTGNVIGLMINAGIHVVATFFIILAVFEYYNVINIEKTYGRPLPTKQEEVPEENSEVNENEHQS